MIPQIFLIFAFFSHLPFPSSSQEQQLLGSLHGPLTNFEACLSAESHARVENITYSFWSSQYVPVLQQGIMNLRFNSSKTPKPYYVITPENGHHVRGAILCCKKYNLDMRIRGAGHDYEGLSSVSPIPFIILDMSRFRNVDIDVESKTARIGAGMTLGQLYYHISQKSAKLAFPAGVCPTVGVTGLFSGGGHGMLVRKFGLALDNVIDATIVDAEGRILDRKSMGEDLFWAIRGGGAASFGVVLDWKIRLVKIPAIVTAFDVVRTFEEGATRAVFKWQELANVLPKEIVIRALITSKPTSSGEKTINVAFEGLYLGRAKKLMKLMETNFPELRLKRKEFKEMSWINTTLFINHYEGQEFSLDDLLNKHSYKRSYFKAKSDYVTLPIREDMLEAIWDVLKQGGTNSGLIEFQPYGGRVSEIPTNETSFPHRDGTLYNIHYLVGWHDESDDLVIEQKLDWLYKIYDFMGDYVEQPRTAYQNYRDLDLGTNEYADEKYSEAWRTWGRMYFKENFKRLAQIKHRVDPDNFFKHEQSIPPLP